MTKEKVSSYELPKTVNFIVANTSRFSAEEYVPYQVELFKHVKAADPTKIKLPAGMAEEWDRLNGVGMEINKVTATSGLTKAKQKKDQERDRLLIHLFGMIRQQKYAPKKETIEAADRLDTRRRITDTNRELRAQGAGNIVSSLIGGLPITSVVVRSSANANAGATHKLSAVIHGVLLLVCVLAIPFILNIIPLSTLAAVLLLVGYKLAKPATLLHFWHKGLYQFIPFAATLVAVVALDLLKGVGIGLAISIIFILQGNMKRAYYLSREELAEADEISLELAEEVSFLNKAAIKKTLKNIRPGSKVTINAERSSYIAGDVLELIEDFANVFAKENDIDVVLKGFKSDYDHEGRDHHSHVRVGHSASI